MPTVYVTAPRDAVDDLASAVVEERLAACANVVECESTYRWDGEVIRGEEEAILLFKTTSERYEDLKARIEEQHPYDVPCVERFDEADVAGAYGDWIEREVA